MPGNIRNSTRSLGRFILLVLVLGIGSITQTTPAQAAKPVEGEILTAYMEVHWPQEAVCVGTTVNISVITIVDKDIPKGDGKVLHVSADPTNGAMVQASSSDRQIGSIAPATVPVSGTDFLANPGEAPFTFSALKAGLTVITFTETYLGQKDTASKAINVKNCEYTVNMNATDIDSGGGVTIWTSGNLEVKITGDGGELTGSGNFEFVSGFSGPECSITYSEFSNPTTITGQVDDNGQLTLQFAYQPGEITENASCPGGSGSFTKAIDLTNTGVLSATFPEDGGTRAIRFTYAGSDMAPGTMIINVEPVPEEAGA